MISAVSQMKKNWGSERFGGLFTRLIKAELGLNPLASWACAVTGALLHKPLLMHKGGPPQMSVENNKVWIHFNDPEIKESLKFWVLTLFLLGWKIIFPVFTMY